MSKAADALRAVKGGTDLGKATALPSIPNVPRTDDARTNQFLSAVKQTLETWAGDRGNSLDSTVTWRNLIENGFAKSVGSSDPTTITPSWINNGGGTNTGDINGQPYAGVPPEPTGFEGDGAFANIILSWDTAPYANHSYTEVWRSSINNLGTAILIGMAAGSVYVDNVGGQAKYYYWIRFVSTTAIKGPYNSTNGLLAETSPDPGFLLELLTGQIQNSQLNKILSSRIDLIDGDASNPQTVAGRILAETNARVSAINTEASHRAQAILDEAAARAGADSNLQTQINLLSAASTGDLGELLSALQEEQTARAAGDAAEATQRETLAAQLRGTYTGTDLAQLTTGLLYSEKQARVSADGALSTSISSLQSTVTNNYNTLNSAIATEATTRASADAANATSISSVGARLDNLKDKNGFVTGKSLEATIVDNKTAQVEADSALSTSISNLSATVSNNFTSLSSSITTEATARASGDSTNATAITQVQSRLDTGDYAAVKTESSTTANAVTGIQAKYSVKTDVNGYVSGFGLISSANDAVPYSQFIFKADQFAFGAPGLTSAYPFVIQASATTVNGVAVPAGVYIDAAYIKNGSITNAKIGNAAIDSAKIADASIGTAKIADASIGTAKIADLSVTTLKIADANITNAKIANLAVTTAKIADANITTAKIADANITNAKIANLAVNSAKISDAAVTTLKIGANSVTVPVRFSFSQPSGTGSVYNGSFAMPDAGSVMIVVSMTLPNSNAVYQLDAGGYEANPSPLPNKFPVSVSSNLKLSINGTEVYNESPNCGFGLLVTFVGTANVSAGTNNFTLTVNPSDYSFINAGNIPRNIYAFVLGTAR